MSPEITFDGSIAVILVSIIALIWVFIGKPSQNSTAGAFEDDDEIISVTKKMSVTLPYAKWDALTDRAEQYGLRRNDYVARLLSTHLDETPAWTDEDESD